MVSIDCCSATIRPTIRPQAARQTRHAVVSEARYRLTHHSPQERIGSEDVGTKGGGAQGDVLLDMTTGDAPQVHNTPTNKALPITIAHPHGAGVEVL